MPDARRAPFDSTQALLAAPFCRRSFASFATSSPARAGCINSAGQARAQCFEKSTSKRANRQLSRRVEQAVVKRPLAQPTTPSRLERPLFGLLWRAASGQRNVSMKLRTSVTLAVVALVVGQTGCCCLCKKKEPVYVPPAPMCAAPVCTTNSCPPGPTTSYMPIQGATPSFGAPGY